MPRVGRRFATLAHAMINTIALTAARQSETDDVIDGLGRRAAMIDVPYRYAGPRDRYGSPPSRSTSRRAVTCAAVICALAVSSVVPGFSLITALVHHHVRVSSA
jgi:hypothetical protein